MDYHALAEKLIDLQYGLHQVPANRQLSILDKGIFFALNYLMAQHKAVNPKELSKEMAVSSARIAALLNHLEEEGLVRRTADPEDKRQIRISLTEEGAQLIHDKRAEVVDILAHTLSQLGPEDANTYIRIQTKIIENFLREG